MYICNYCGSRFNSKLETCSNCGAKICYDHFFVPKNEINKVDGEYKINDDLFKRLREDEKTILKVIRIISIIILILEFPFVLAALILLFMLFVDFSWDALSLFLFLIFVVVCIPACFYYIYYVIKKSTDKKIIKIKELAKNGILYKYVPYKIISNKDFDNLNKYAVKVYFEKNGYNKTLTSDIITFKGSNTESMQLLIDPDNLDNYYINFDIVEDGE